MPQYRFVVNGDFVDFYDGTQHVIRVRNTSQDVDWFYTASPGISFEIDGLKYKTENANEIEIDEVTLSANTEFDAAITAIFPNLAQNDGGGGITAIGNVGAGDAKGASITGTTLFLHKATETLPGLVGVDGTPQTFGGPKSFSGTVQFQNLTTFESLQKIIAGSTPGTPSSGYVYLYAKSDKKLYFKDDAGTETELGGGGVEVIDITYANLLTAISGSDLIVGATYKITNRGDRGLSFIAISAFELSKIGVRKMLCPAFYGTGANGGNTWIGVWNATKNPNIGELTIWGGLVWESLTGDIGTADSDILLDAVNWVVVPKASFSNNEYTELQFGVSYDVENDWIERQWDGSGNVFGIDYLTEQAEQRGFNMCDVSDWNYDSSGLRFYNNKAYGVFNNSCQNIISNTVFRVISNNSNSGNIIDNWVGSEISNNSNAGIIHDNFIMVNIRGNSNNGAIRYNRCENLDGNSNGGHIERNVIPGHIEDNSNVGIISWNKNNGHIESCESGEDPCDIHHNINNGNISGTFTDHVLDTVVDKS